MVRNGCGHLAGTNDQRSGDRGNNSPAFQSCTEDLLGAFQPTAERTGVTAEFDRGLLLSASLEHAEHDGIAEIVRQLREFLIQYAKLVGELRGLIHPFRRA